MEDSILNTILSIVSKSSSIGYPVSDWNRKPGPDEKLVVNMDYIQYYPCSNISKVRGLFSRLEVILYIQGSSKARRISRACKAQTNVSHYPTQARARSKKLPDTARYPKNTFQLKC